MEIRHYRESDKEDLRYICRATAGKEWSSTKKTLQAVTIIFNDYFTEQEPENVFVLADDNDKAVGYILCSTDYKKYMKLNRTIYKKRARKVGFIFPITLDGILFLLWTIRKRPVHLHLDILPDYQRQGWGTKLINTLCDHLRSKGINHLSIYGMDKNSAGYKMYTKYGFKEIIHYSKNNVSLSIDL